MSEVIRLKATITADMSGLTAAVAATTSAMQSVSRKMDGVSRDTAEAARHMKVAALGALSEIADRSMDFSRKFVEIGKSMFDLASDTSESLDKVNRLFGDSAKKVTEWSKTTDTQLGYSQAAALDATGAFGALLRSMNFAQGASADMSVSLARLASDLASMDNSTPKEAMEAIRSALVGETEPIRRFGVNMSEITLKAEAMRIGLIKTTKEGLSPAQKAAASYSLILAQTARAHKNFSDTAFGVANQQRILTAQFENLKTTLGQRLLPIGLKVIETMRYAVEVFGKLPAPVQNTIGVVAALAAAFPVVVLSVTRFVETAKLAWSVVASGATALAAALGVSMPQVALIIGLVAVAVGGLYLAWRNNLGGIQQITRQFVKQLGEQLLTAAATVSVFVKFSIMGWSKLIEHLAWLVRESQRGWKLFIDAIQTAYEGVKGAVVAMWDVLSKSDTPLGAFLNAWVQTFQTVLSVTVEVVKGLVGGPLLLLFQALAKIPGVGDAFANIQIYFTQLGNVLGILIENEKEKIRAQLEGLADIFKFEGFKAPKFQGYAMPDFKNMGLPGLPGAGDKDKKAKKTPAQEQLEQFRDAVKSLHDQLTEDRASKGEVPFLALLEQRYPLAFKAFGDKARKLAEDWNNVTATIKSRALAEEQKKALEDFQRSAREAVNGSRFGKMFRDTARKFGARPGDYLKIALRDDDGEVASRFEAPYLPGGGEIQKLMARLADSNGKFNANAQSEFNKFLLMAQAQDTAAGSLAQAEYMDKLAESVKDARLEWEKMTAATTLDRVALEKFGDAFDNLNQYERKAAQDIADFIDRQETLTKSIEKQKATLEAQAGVYDRISAAMADLAASFDKSLIKSNYFDDAMAKLNLTNADLTDSVRASVQQFADQWQTFDKLKAAEAKLKSFADGIRSSFEGAFTAAMRRGSDFFTTLQSMATQAFQRIVAQWAAGELTKLILGATGVTQKREDLAAQAKAARDSMMKGSVAVAAAAALLKEAAKTYEEAAKKAAGAATKQLFASAVGGAFGGGLGIGSGSLGAFGGAGALGSIGIGIAANQALGNPVGKAASWVGARLGIGGRKQSGPGMVTNHITINGGISNAADLARVDSHVLDMMRTDLRTAGVTI